MRQCLAMEIPMPWKNSWLKKANVLVFELLLGEGKILRGMRQGSRFVLDSHENQSMQDSFDCLNKSLCCVRARVYIEETE